jgi:hypothetical protein
MAVQTMEVLTELESLSDSDLGAVIARSEQLLSARDKQRKTDAMEQIKALAKQNGLSVGKKAKKRK